MSTSVTRNLICMFPGLQVLGLVVFSFVSVLSKTQKSGQSRKLFPGPRDVLGSVPPVAEMKNMTMVEEKLIACCRAKCCIVKLQDHRTNVILPPSQREIKGNIIVYPQRVGSLRTSSLRPSLTKSGWDRFIADS
jgi:hypothetical protein